MKPIVSIIIPCYNCGKYIRKCLESLVHQLDNPEELEILVIDDCSKDDSVAVIEAMMKQYPSIRLIKHATNQSVSVSRNDGLDAAAGDFIIFLDADDWLFDGALKAYLACENASHADIVWCNAKCVDEQGRHTEFSKKCRHVKSGVYTDLQSSPDFYPYQFIFDNACCKLFRAELIKENRLRFFPPLTFSQDTLFTHQAFFRSRTVALHPELYCYAYYQHPQSRVHSINIPVRLELLTLLVTKLNEEISQRGLPEKILLRKAGEFFLAMKKYPKNFADRRALLQAWRSKPELAFMAGIILRHGTLKQRMIVKAVLKAPFSIAAALLRWW